jgi:hypothetical protein
MTGTLGAAHLSFDEIDLGNGAQLTQAIAPKVTSRCGSPCPTVTTIRAARTAPPMKVSAACPGNGRERVGLICSAIKASGERCRHDVRDGGDLCAAHQQIAERDRSG